VGYWNVIAMGRGRHDTLHLTDAGDAYLGLERLGQPLPAMGYSQFSPE